MQAKRGGGDWEEYCPACGLPFGKGYGMAHGYNWLTRAFGFEVGDPHRIFELADYSYVGTMEIYGLRRGNNNSNNASNVNNNTSNANNASYVSNTSNTNNNNNASNANNNASNSNNNNNNNGEDEFTILQEDADPSYYGEYEGVAVHQDCVKAIEHALGRPLNYKDALVLRNTEHKNLLGYGKAQFFNWDKKTDLPAWFFKSPLQNEQAALRIMKALPRELKETSVTRSRAVHAMMEGAPGLVPNFATRIAPYISGLEPHEYMPERYQRPLRQHERQSRRKSRKRVHRKSRKAQRRTRRR